MDDHREAPPVNPLPPIVIVLFLALVGPEIMFFLGEKGLIGGREAVGWRLEYVQRYGFSGDIFDWMITNGRYPLEHAIRLISYIFVHESFTSTLFAAVLTLALGKMVGEALGQVAVAVLFLGGGIFGALVYGLLLNDSTWLMGGFPAVYGLIGGYSFVMWMYLNATGEQQLRAFSLIAMLLGLQLIWGVLFGPTVGWVADLAGFVFGFMACTLLVPGAMARIMQALRRD